MRTSHWLKKEGETLLLPPILSIKHLSKVVGVPQKAILQGLCHKNGKSHWYRHNRIHYEFENKSQILFPYQYAMKKLKQFPSFAGVQTRSTEVEPQPIDLDEYSSTHVFDAQRNKKQCVVCVMGHVDHGKTTLLDSIRETNVVDAESGGITQKVSCYHHRLPSQHPVTLIDTPGHQVFFRMRSNSIIVADAVILVIDVMEGVGSQTIEVIRKAKELSIPVLLALNKIDKCLDLNCNEISGSFVDINRELRSNARLNGIVDETKANLRDMLDKEDDVASESLSFDVVPISAKYNLNLDRLLHSVDILCNVLESESMSPRDDINAQCIVVEILTHHKRAIVVMLIVHAGVLQPNTVIVGGHIAGTVQSMQDPTDDSHLRQVFPGMAVKCGIRPFNDICTEYHGSTHQLPKSGEVMFVMNDKQSAAHILEYRAMCDNLQRAVVPHKSDLSRISSSSSSSSTIHRMHSLDAVDDYDETRSEEYDTQRTVFHSLNEEELGDRLMDDDDDLEEQLNRINDINKAIILRCDSLGSLNVLKQIVYAMESSSSSSSHEGEEDENMGKRVKIVESGIGNVVTNDLELQEQINENEEDECRIYMFGSNVDLTKSGLKFYQELMRNEFPDETISPKHAKQLFQTDKTIKQFSVFTDFQNDVRQWLYK